MAEPHHNWPHRKVREQIAPSVTASTLCAYLDCGRRLDDPPRGRGWPAWDWAHDDDGDGTTYLGPSHEWCNRSRHAESPRSNIDRSKVARTARTLSRIGGRLRRVTVGEVQQ